MPNRIKFPLVVYLIWGLFEVAVEFVHWDYPVLHGVLKGGLMPLLMWMVVANRSLLGEIFYLLLSALFFSWLGDLLLLGSEADELYFMSGLAAFLIAHVFYIFAFLRAKARDHNIVILRKYPLIGLAILALPVLMLRQVGPHLDDLLIPVVIYALVITGMALAAVARFNKTNVSSFWLVAIGAFTFMLSDSLIALNRFNEEIAYASAYIMVTYIAAQLLIVLGLIACETLSGKANEREPVHS